MRYMGFQQRKGCIEAIVFHSSASPGETYELGPSSTVSFNQRGVFVASIGKGNCEKINDLFSQDVCCKNIQLNDPDGFSVVSIGINERCVIKRISTNEGTGNVVLTQDLEFLSEFQNTQGFNFHGDQVCDNLIRIAKGADLTKGCRDGRVSRDADWWARQGKV